jgi:hemerythrin-like domain-containing protein
MHPFETPVAPSFDHPIALLMACHDKVRRFAELTVRIERHLASSGNGADAARAAINVLRYFDLAAPLHHADEEEDLFPVLRQLGDKALNAAIDALEQEHEQLGVLWQAVRPWLLAVSSHQSPSCVPDVAEFALRYPAHANREEAEIYGAASRLPTDVLRGLGIAMGQRRGAKP